MAGEHPTRTSKGGHSPFTPEGADELVRVRGEGNAIWVCAEAIGVSEKTVRNWLARGDKGEEPFAAFTVRFRKAFGKAARAPNNTLYQAATREKDPCPNAAAKWLALHKPRHRVEVSGPEGGPIKVEAKTITVDELAARVAQFTGEGSEQQ